jgi:hypothetical protein
MFHNNIAVKFRTLGTASIHSQHDKCYNECKKLVEWTKCYISLCGVYDLALHGQNETDQSLNWGIFLDLNSHTAKLDSVDVGLLGFNAMWTSRWIQTFWTNILHPYSALKMKTVCSSETLVSIYKSTWRYNPEEQCWHLHHHENLKSHKLDGFSKDHLNSAIVSKTNKLLDCCIMYSWMKMKRQIS